jgi:predicted nucleotidyltransferase
MYKHHEDSIHNILKILKSEEEVLGILLSGSIAHGFDTPVSDIDIMIIISEENYRKRAEEGKLTYYEKESCTYEEGYVDGKYISISFMEKVALIGSEPAKFAFDGAVILYSKIEGLEELLQKITKYPIEKKEENIKRFYAQFEAYKWYCNEAIKHENDYLLMHSISNMVLFGGRLILADNEVLYPYHKWFLKVLDNIENKPKDMMKIISNYYPKKTWKVLKNFMSV